jgi:hypothetical protein
MALNILLPLSAHYTRQSRIVNWRLIKPAMHDNQHYVNSLWSNLSHLYGRQLRPVTCWLVLVYIPIWLLAEVETILFWRKHMCWVQKWTLQHGIAYDVYVSYMVRCARAYTQYQDVCVLHKLLITRFLSQSYLRDEFRRAFKYFLKKYPDLIGKNDALLQTH